MTRIMQGVKRPDLIMLTIDGQPVTAHPGETVAAALLMSARTRFRDDRSGRARGMFCNMGTCSECLLWIASEAGRWRRARSCLTPVAPGMAVRTTEPEAGHDG